MLSNWGLLLGLKGRESRSVAKWIPLCVCENAKQALSTEGVVTETAAEKSTYNRMWDMAVGTRTADNFECDLPFIFVSTCTWNPKACNEQEQQRERVGFVTL